MPNYPRVDARHQPCPMPILLLKKWYKQNADQAAVIVMATDSNSQQDLGHFCRANGWDIAHMVSPPDEFHYLIHLKSSA